MAGSRTIKTLGALLAAMTLGAFALMLMQSDLPVPSELAAASASAPLNDVKELIVERPYHLSHAWRNVIVHSSVGESADITQRCHFIIDAVGNIIPTPRWIRQEAGDHVVGNDWNASSIGIVVVGDARHAKSANQAVSLRKLLQGLSENFGIPRAQIYPHGEINQTACGLFATSDDTAVAAR